MYRPLLVRERHSLCVNRADVSTTPKGPYRRERSGRSYNKRHTETKQAGNKPRRSVVRPGRNSAEGKTDSREQVWFDLAGRLQRLVPPPPFARIVRYRDEEGLSPAFRLTIRLCRQQRRQREKGSPGEEEEEEAYGSTGCD